MSIDSLDFDKESSKCSMHVQRRFLGVEVIRELKSISKGQSFCDPLLRCEGPSTPTHASLQIELLNHVWLHDRSPDWGALARSLPGSCGFVKE